MGLKLKLCGAVLVAFVAMIAHVYPAFDFSKKVVEKNNGNCGRKMTKHPGFEDLAYLTPNIAVTCSNDNHEMFGATGKGPAATRDGVCYLVRFDGKAATMKDAVSMVRLDMGTFPFDRIAFHPHGIYVAQPPGWRDGGVAASEDMGLLPLLYVINHAYEKGGERIEAFTLNVDTGALNHIRSITHPYFDGRAFGVLNDLVVKGYDAEIFVTVWKTFPFPKKGRNAPEGLWDTLRQKVLAIPAMVFTRSTELVRCDISDPYHTLCEQAVTGFGMANGITHDKNFDNLFVVDLTAHELVVVDISNSHKDTFKARHGYQGVEIDREPFTLPPLTKIGTLPLKPNTLDNIEMNHWRSTNDTTVMYGGSIVRVVAALDEEVVPSPGGITRYEVQRVAVVKGAKASVQKSFAMVGAEDVIVHDGTKHCGESAGVVLASEGKEIGVMGSYKDKGLFLCEL